jgi:hypothetical protein
MNIKVSYFVLLYKDKIIFTIANNSIKTVIKIIHVPLTSNKVKAYKIYYNFIVRVVLSCNSKTMLLARLQPISSIADVVADISVSEIWHRSSNRANKGNALVQTK